MVIKITTTVMVITANTDIALTPCPGTVLGSIHVLAHLILTANLRDQCCHYPILQTRKPRHREVKSSPESSRQGDSGAGS